VTTLPYLFSLEALWQSILELPEGNVAFAHLLLPHSPYVTNTDCTIRTSLQEWKYNVLSSTRGDVPNTKDSRENHYREYFKQVQCVYLKLDELFKRMDDAGLFENSVIIIHGDHGSRIMKTEPTIENEQTLSKQDIVDGYSTLFAVKFPKQVGYYDTQTFPIEFLLQEKVVKPLLGEKEIAPPSAPFVFLQSEDPAIQDLKPIPYPISP
jgi:arylsulfatase A-like enzyme